jgi:hypothetical protein
MEYKTTTKGERRWHFAVSARAAVHPEPVLMLRSHVLFSDDGLKLWESAAHMHRARRSQCKNWWNDDWRDRLLATMTGLADGEIQYGPESPATIPWDDAAAARMKKIPAFVRGWW